VPARQFPRASLNDVTTYRQGHWPEGAGTLLSDQAAAYDCRFHSIADCNPMLQ
jgi:hypothetical protein